MRLIIEKPFGTTLEEARELNRRVLAIFDEPQVFRIDHYLGKETVQNMMAFRFANGMFEPLWNRNYIDSVQITAAEDLGIGSRADYYDRAGALRDLIQNHMLQLLCHVAMEPPVSFTAEEVRNEKVKVLQAIPEPTARGDPADGVRAQYAAGHAGGENVRRLPGRGGRAGGLAHRDLRRAAPGGRQLALGGRAVLPAHRQAPGAQGHRDRGHAASRCPTSPSARSGSLGVQPNQLVLTLQPNEGVSLRLGAKIPGTRMIIRPVNMEFLYGTAFLSQSPEAYERLITDAMRGDATLFTRNDEVEAQWRICDPIVEHWDPPARHDPDTPRPVAQYEAGSQGPKEAEALLLEGHSWRAI